MVEWKKIKDVCSNICSGGTPNTKNRDYYYGDIPWLRTQEVDWGNIYDTEIKISQKGLDNSSAKIIEKDCVIVAMYGATAAKVAINKIPLSTNQACCNLKINKDISCYRYVYYWLCKEYHKLKALGEGSQNNISGLKIKDYPIPIPSLSEQNRIVGILDTFTDSIENLKQQIAQRRKQYEHYRDQLLDLEGKEGVEMKKISEIAKSYTGLTYKPENVNDTGTLVLRSSNIDEDVLAFDDNVYVQMEIPERAVVHEKDLLICVRNGSKRLVGKCAMITKHAEGMAFGAFMTILRSIEINSKYLFYVWQSTKVKKQYKGDEAMPIAQITAKDFQRIVIPVPSQEDQSRIVTILDTFEASIMNLESQLKERQKQYEYYRNKLLSFEKEEH